MLKLSTAIVTLLALSSNASPLSAHKRSPTGTPIEDSDFIFKLRVPQFEFPLTAWCLSARTGQPLQLKPCALENGAQRWKIRSKKGKSILRDSNPKIDFCEAVVTANTDKYFVGLTALSCDKDQKMSYTYEDSGKFSSTENSEHKLGFSGVCFKNGQISRAACNGGYPVLAHDEERSKNVTEAQEQIQVLTAINTYLNSLNFAFLPPNPISYLNVTEKAMLYSGLKTMSFQRIRF